jgi:capsular exopolysaccharide synthesis family protein
MSNIARLTPQSSDMLPEAGGGGGGQDSGSIINVREIIGILRRRYIMIAAIAVVGTALTALWVNQLTPVYQAESQVLIDPSKEMINPKIPSVNQGIAQTYTMIETQIAIMRSRDLAVKAVRRLDLANHPLYNPALAKPQPSAWSSMLAPITALFSDAKPEPPKAPVSIAPQTAEEKERLQDVIVNAYLGGLRAVQAGTSQVILLRFVSPDPVLAAKAANTAAQVYLDDLLASRGESTQSALKFLSEKVEELRLKMIAAEQALTNYRTKNGILQSGDQSPTTQQLNSYNQQLVEVRALIRNLETSLEQVKAVQRSQGSMDSVGAVMTNPFIAQMRTQSVELERKIADARTQLRDNHPQVLALRNELREVQGRIGSEIGKIAANIANDLSLARQRETSLNAEIKRLTGDQASLQSAEVELNTLKLNAQTSRQVYEATLARFNEVSITDDKVQKADARILNMASVPGGPIAPRKDLYIMMALLISLAIGVGLAVLIELLDSGFRSVNQLEQMANAPALGMVPFQTGKVGRNKRPWDTVLDKPNSSFAEAIRTIRTGLLLSSVDHPPRSVLVTSSVPGEGKTTTALALASAAAASGLRTVIVDCDMRQPSMHVNLGATNELGLSDYLTGNAQLEDLIHIDDRSGLHYICAGRLPPSPTDLLSSTRMKQLLQQLSAAFQMVMLDTPPILAVSDALLLVRSVDKTIFVVRWEKTRRDVALNGLKGVFDAGARVGGLVLSQVNLRKHAQYDYSDSGVYYYRGYKRYYVD